MRWNYQTLESEPGPRELPGCGVVDRSHHLAETGASLLCGFRLVKKVVAFVTKSEQTPVWPGDQLATLLQSLVIRVGGVT